MLKLFSDKLIDIKPYVAGEQSNKENIIKLNANENPYPPSPLVTKAISELNIEELRKYPNSQADKLCEAIAKYKGLNRDQVFVANGSDEVIAFSMLAFFNSSMPILFPDITYSFYPVWCSLFKIPYRAVPLDNSLQINFMDYNCHNGGIIFPNPNAPTGIEEEKCLIEDILKLNKDVIVIIDEAYVDFGSYSCVELLKKYENLVVIQTFSKSRSLAGLRIGYAMASKELIGVLNSVKNSFNSYTVDTVAQAAAIASINDDEYFIKTVRTIKETREVTAAMLTTIGFKVHKSDTNFLLAEPPSTISAKALMEKLKDDDIFVRHFDLERINSYLRISIGTDEEMRALFKAVKKYI